MFAEHTPAEYYEHIARDYRKNRFANSYGRFVDAEERRWLVHALTQRPEGLVLDLACGDGRFSEYCDLGIDLSDGMLRVARAHHSHGAFLRADATAWPLAGESLSAAFSFHLAMHLSVAQLRELLTEARRCLKPGGLLLIDMPGRLRRHLRPHTSDIAGWHGHSAYDVQDVLELVPGFSLVFAQGLLMLPLHRVPKRIRLVCAGLDRMLCRLMRPLASYQMLCLRRE